MDIETDPKFAEELAAAIATHKPLPIIAPTEQKICIDIVTPRNN